MPHKQPTEHLVVIVCKGIKGLFKTSLQAFMSLIIHHRDLHEHCSLYPGQSTEITGTPTLCQIVENLYFTTSHLLTDPV